MFLSRRQFITAFAFACLTTSKGFNATTFAQQRYLNAEVYKIQLYAVTEEQKGFIDMVITLAEKQVIPPATVEKCFFYARKKADKHRRYYYFKKALEFALKEKGYDLNGLMK